MVTNHPASGMPSSNPHPSSRSRWHARCSLPSLTPVDTVRWRTTTNSSPTLASSTPRHDTPIPTLIGVEDWGDPYKLNRGGLTGGYVMPVPAHVETRSTVAFLLRWAIRSEPATNSHAGAPYTSHVTYRSSWSLFLSSIDGATTDWSPSHPFPPRMLDTSLLTTVTKYSGTPRSTGSSADIYRHGEAGRGPPNPNHRDRFATASAFCLSSDWDDWHQVPTGRGLRDVRRNQSVARAGHLSEWPKRSQGRAHGGERKKDSGPNALGKWAGGIEGRWMDQMAAELGQGKGFSHFYFISFVFSIFAFQFNLPIPNSSLILVSNFNFVIWCQLSVQITLICSSKSSSWCIVYLLSCFIY
jgi:hypothetical protein